jgi:GTP-binding protein
MEIVSAAFEQSNTDWRKCPKPNKPEYAFIGRSNVGKSSLINMLTGRKDLAKVSGTPGKTQLINHFLINESWYLADLPGYGYAKVSKKQRTRFHNFTIEYLQNRENLICVFVLIDARLSPQKIDIEFMEFCALRGFPFVLIFTKMDKLNQREKKENIEKYQAFLSESWEELPQMFFTSAEKYTGRDEVLNYIEELNNLFECP